jgi:hypothetical protein
MLLLSSLFYWLVGRRLNRLRAQERRSGAARAEL